MTQLFPGVSRSLLLKAADSSAAGKPVKLSLTADHDPSSKTIVFTLNTTHLPGDGGRDFFIYHGVRVGRKFAVKHPELALCDSPLVRTFLTGLINQGTFEVVSFGLEQTEIKYGSFVSKQSVVEMYVKACAHALSITGDEKILVLEPRA